MNFDDSYFLLHAYDVLGRHLYGSDWEGNEFKQAPVPSYEEVETIRKPYQDTLKKISERLTDIQDTLSKTIKEDEISRLSREEKELLWQSGEIETVLHQNWKPGTSHSRQYERYIRRVFVEKKITEGMKLNAFSVILNGSTIVDWSFWERQRGCRIVFHLSLIRVRNDISSQRWGFATINRTEFHEWLKIIEPISGNGIENLSPEERFAIDLRKMVQEGSKKHPVQWYLEFAQAEYGLGPRPARRVWETNVPASWRSSGRPRKS